MESFFSVQGHVLWTCQPSSYKLWGAGHVEKVEMLRWIKTWLLKGWRWQVWKLLEVTSLASWVAPLNLSTSFIFSIFGEVYWDPYLPRSSLSQRFTTGHIRSLIKRFCLSSKRLLKFGAVEDTAACDLDREEQWVKSVKDKLYVTREELGLCHHMFPTWLSSLPRRFYTFHTQHQLKPKTKADHQKLQVTAIEQPWAPSGHC